MHEGHCLCGELRFRVKGEIQDVENCHCGMCRRAHGTPYSTFARVAADDLEITRGKEQVATYASSEVVERSFCRSCGTRFTFRFKGLPEMVWVAVGTLEEDPKLAPRGHIFVGSKASWHQILDDLPQHEGYPAAARRLTEGPGSVLAATGGGGGANRGGRPRPRNASAREPRASAASPRPARRLL